MMETGREVARRTVLIGLAGVAASSALYGLSHLLDGFVAAVLYMLALLVAPVAIGVAIATAINQRLDALPALTRPVGSRPETSESHRCGGCGAPMMAMNFAWVCSACDLAPARH